MNLSLYRGFTFVVIPYVISDSPSIVSASSSDYYRQGWSIAKQLDSTKIRSANVFGEPASHSRFKKPRP